MMKNCGFRLIATIWLCSLFFCPRVALSQKKVVDDYSDDVTESVDPPAERRCLQQNISTARTYRFQRVPKLKGYGPRPWYFSLKKIIPFWNDNETAKYSSGDVSAMKELGLLVPNYETERSKTIRLQIDKALVRQQIEGGKKWSRWLKNNPNAPEAEKNQMEFQLRFAGLAAEKLPRFDWRDAGLHPGAVDYQGLKCDTCWAFATRDALQMSRQLNARRANKTFLPEAPEPSARQLLSCMGEGGDYCEPRKPDEAFTFMVDHGLPLGGSRDYTIDPIRWQDGIVNTDGWRCDKTDSVKALTWDYVGGSPQKVADTAAIKRAVVTNGAVVTTVNYDDCLSLYASGVFNEEQFDDGSHMLLIVGWDDVRQAWLVKNSYGKQWGERGYGWIKYGSNNIGQFAAFVVADPRAEEKFLRRNL